MPTRQLTPPSPNGKTEIATHDPHGFNLETFFETVNEQLGSRFKAFAVILSDASGARLGFTRDGWAIDPDDSGASEQFTLGTPTAIGSVTKLFTTTVCVLKRSRGAGQYRTLDERLHSRFSHFLPRRSWDDVHADYRNVTIGELLQHKAGFQKTGDEHISVRLSRPRELDTAPGTRTYSNTSMGIFHFIFAKWGLYYPYALHAAEVEHRNADIDVYNEAIQTVTSEKYNVDGLYEEILRPLRIQASADPANGAWPVGMPEYFEYGTPARTYSSRTDTSGVLLPDVTRHAASGGLYMSAQSLATFVSALNSGPLLNSEQRGLMINSGPADDVFAFYAGNTEGGRYFHHNGLRDGSHTDVLIFPNRFSAVFVANSPDDTANASATLRAAYAAAHT